MTSTTYTEEEDMKCHYVKYIRSVAKLRHKNQPFPRPSSTHEPLPCQVNTKHWNVKYTLTITTSSTHQLLTCQMLEISLNWSRYWIYSVTTFVYGFPNFQTTSIDLMYVRDPMEVNLAWKGRKIWNIRIPEYCTDRQSMKTMDMSWAFCNAETPNVLIASLYGTKLSKMISFLNWIKKKDVPYHEPML